MKKVKQLKGWGIYELSLAEKEEYGFNFAVITPENMECYGPGGLLPSDTDMEMESFGGAVLWINNYREC